MANTLIAIKNIIEFGNYVVSVKRNNAGAANRVNAEGDALEDYIQDAYASALNLNGQARQSQLDSVFSYIGNASNPPDIMIKGGAAIEVKKLQSFNTGQLQLNSSYPKDILHNTNPLLTIAAKQCEVWTDKEMVYSIGVVKDMELKRLWFAYGDCFCADEKRYLTIRDTVVSALRQIEGVTLAETDELARVNHIDSLKNTDLRVRGMWLLKNPNKYFENLVRYDSNAKFQLFCIMRRDTYDGYPEQDREALGALNDIVFQNVKIKDPNDINNEVDAVLISYTVQ